MYNEQVKVKIAQFGHWNYEIIIFIPYNVNFDLIFDIHFEFQLCSNL